MALSEEEESGEMLHPPFRGQLRVPAMPKMKSGEL